MIVRERRRNEDIDWLNERIESSLVERRIRGIDIQSIIRRRDSSRREFRSAKFRRVEFSSADMGGDCAAG